MTELSSVSYLQFGANSRGLPVPGINGIMAPADSRRCSTSFAGCHEFNIIHAAVRFRPFHRT